MINYNRKITNAYISFGNLANVVSVTIILYSAFWELFFVNYTYQLGLLKLDCRSVIWQNVRLADGSESGHAKEPTYALISSIMVQILLCPRILTSKAVFRISALGNKGMLFVNMPAESVRWVFSNTAAIIKSSYLPQMEKNANNRTNQGWFALTESKREDRSKYMQWPTVAASYPEYSERANP